MIHSFINGAQFESMPWTNQRSDDDALWSSSEKTTKKLKNPSSPMDLKSSSTTKSKVFDEIPQRNCIIEIVLVMFADEPIFISKSQPSSAPVARLVPLSRLTDSFLDGTISVNLEELQRAWETDPSSMDESWDNFFRNFVGQAATSPGISGQTFQESMRLLLLVRAYQVNAHMKANLDPLNLEERRIPEDLYPTFYGFTEADLDREFFIGVWKMGGFLSENRPVQTLRAILTRLEQAYCGSVGYEYMHIADREKCNWLRDKISII